MDPLLEKIVTNLRKKGAPFLEEYKKIKNPKAKSSMNISKNQDSVSNSKIIEKEENKVALAMQSSKNRRENQRKTNITGQANSNLNIFQRHDSKSSLGS